MIWKRFLLALGLMSYTLSFIERVHLLNETLPLTIQDGWYKEKLPGDMLGFFFNSGKYLVCDTTEKQEPKSWLRTDFIEFNGAKRVFIYISYTVRKCKSNSKYCKEEFKLYTAHTNKSALSPKPPNGFEEIAVAKPTNLKDGVPDEKDVIVLNATIKAKMDGFYLAFLDQGVCLTLYSIKVMYYFCPERGKYLDFIKFPKTISPAEDIVGSQGQEVHGSCSDSNAKNKTELLGVCTTKGVWDVNNDVRCLCKPGYEYLPTPRAHCAECGYEQYKSSLNNSKCKICPSGSYSFGRSTMCVCQSGLFRMNEKNNDEPCYALPNGPKSIIVTPLNIPSIRVSWPPTSDKTVTFTVECFVCKNDKDKKCVEPCSSKTIFHPGKSGLKRQVLVSGLKSGSRFKFLVFGVKRLNQNVDKSEWKYSVTFGNTKEVFSGKYSTPSTVATTAAYQGYYHLLLITILGVLLGVSVMFNFAFLVCFTCRRHSKENTGQQRKRQEKFSHRTRVPFWNSHFRPQAEYDMVDMSKMRPETHRHPSDNQNETQYELVDDKEQGYPNKTIYQSVSPHKDTYTSLSPDTKLPPKTDISKTTDAVYQEIQGHP